MFLWASSSDLQISGLISGEENTNLLTLFIAALPAVYNATRNYDASLAKTKDLILHLKN